MALPITLGSWFEPVNKGPQRTILQNVVSGSTSGIFNIIPTAGNANTIKLMNLVLAVTNPTAGAAVDVYLRPDKVLSVPGTALGTWNFDFRPYGVVAAVPVTTANHTTSCYLNITGATVGVVAYVILLAE